MGVHGVEPSRTLYLFNCDHFIHMPKVTTMGWLLTEAGLHQLWSYVPPCLVTGWWSLVVMKMWLKKNSTFYVSSIHRSSCIGLIPDLSIFFWSDSSLPMWFSICMFSSQSTCLSTQVSDELPCSKLLAGRTGLRHWFSGEPLYEAPWSVLHLSLHLHSAPTNPKPTFGIFPPPLWVEWDSTWYP